MCKIRKSVRVKDVKAVFTWEERRSLPLPKVVITPALRGQAARLNILHCALRCINAGRVTTCCLRHLR